MTVIAFKNGVLATDTATFQNDIIVGYYPKIQANARFCWAACGLLPEVAAFAEWALSGFNTGTRPTKSESFGAVVVYRNGPVYKCGETFVLYDVTHYKAPIVDGAASEYMLGIMHGGSSAIDAVNAAIKHSVWAGGECHAFNTNIWDFCTL
jgi:hypothetical protein